MYVHINMNHYLAQGQNTYMSLSYLWGPRGWIDWYGSFIEVYLHEFLLKSETGAGAGGWGSWWVRTPLFGGPPSFVERGKMLRICTRTCMRMCRFFNI